MGIFQNQFSKEERPLAFTGMWQDWRKKLKTLWKIIIITKYIFKYVYAELKSFST